DEALALLRVKPGGVYVDGTFGLGGHGDAMLRRCAPDGRVVGFEWDGQAIGQARQGLSGERQRLTLVRRNFAEMGEALAELGLQNVDGILLDVGCSSMQLDQGGRGFSFQVDELLDMRMDQRRPTTAADILAGAEEVELADIFFHYGDEIQARRVAARIVAERRGQPITTTKQLARIVAEAIPRRFHPARIHVATRVFQALRIAVNDELKNLAAALQAGPALLAMGGRMGVISFHSLEDRLAKRTLSGDKLLKLLTPKPIVPGRDEIRRNPRARSARLRGAEKIA
ncbi:MAG: 16S rRNA (cytosine(1402)-N(4))-methyltransferase RsmH, partial [Desulfofustis sp. PB-SRB1]|nr:16S rRNA (cytosine(1402)-N(4))-methyltransferase RsmH [Desulfofustis sp. PB-SRB1]